MTSLVVSRRLVLGLAVPASVLAVSLALILLRRRSHRRRNLRVATESCRMRERRRCAYKAVAMPAAEAAPVVATDAEFAAHWADFELRARQFGYCGLDCEWRWRDMELRGGGPGPLALLQLATADGCVLLVRVQQLTLVPPQLEEFLADASVLKFGVGIDNDVDKLRNDLDCAVAGCVDLRHLVDRLPQAVASTVPRRGLKPLARDLLGVDYTSHRWVARTDWELPQLEPHQIRYAALDALVGAMMPVEILALMGEHSSAAAGAAPASVAEISAAWIDVKHAGLGKSSRPDSAAPNGAGMSPTQLSGQARVKLGTFARQNPLYHNCQMLAPDGQLMCTMDRRKADWYTDRGLATVVSTDPTVHAIQLRFEPRGRPTGDQQYYLTDKENLCVVCGSADSLQRKKVIPDEYRRHFPELMKSHKSHDVLLLCVGCHAVSERHTETYKNLLIQEFGLNQDQVTALSSDALRRAKSLAKALLAQAQGRASIPALRLMAIGVELRRILPTLTADGEEADGISDADDAMEFSEEQLQAILSRTDGSPAAEPGRLAGIIVRQCLETGRLLELELRWRRYFLDTMQPRHLPPRWSVGHQHDRLGPRLDGGAELPTPRAETDCD